MTIAEIELPSAEVREEAQLALRRLSTLMKSDKPRDVKLRAERDHESTNATIPRQAYRLFLEVLAQLAEGNAVTIVPVHAELTTQQAADMLNVSRPYFVRMLERRVIPHHKVGTHRRVYARDVLAYKRSDDQRRRQIARELTELAEETETGY